MSGALNYECKPAHEVIIRRLNGIVVLLESDVAENRRDDVFARYSRLHALLSLLEEMIIPEDGAEEVFSAVHDLAARLEKGLPSLMTAFSLRVWRTLERLNLRKNRIVD